MSRDAAHYKPVWDTIWGNYIRDLVRLPSKIENRFAANYHPPQRGGCTMKMGCAQSLL